MATVESIKPWTSGMTELSADDMNALIDWAKSLRRGIRTMGSGLQGGVDSHGLKIGLTFQPEIVHFAEIVDEGPASEADFTDPRYWFKTMELTTVSTDDCPLLEFTIRGGADTLFIHDCCTNVAELQVGSHKLAVGEVVRVHEILDLTDPSNRRYWIAGASVAPPKWFKITAAATIGGATNRWKYTGVEQEAIDEGWQTLSGGETVTKLFNAIEANNDGTGVQGHGVDIDGADYPAGFAVMPLAIGAVVRAWLVTVSVGGTPELQWWACDPNADDGTCSTGALAIALGGTSATTAVAAFDNLAPTTTKGDLAVYDGTNNVRRAVGANGLILTADAAEPTGVKWAALASHTHTEGEITDLDHTTVTNASSKISIGGTARDPTVDVVESALSLANLGTRIIDNLSDVVISGTPADNEILAYNTGTGKWINQTAAEVSVSVVGHTHTTSEITDISGTGGTDGEFWTWKTSGWIDSTMASIGTGADVFKAWNGTSNAHEFRSIIGGVGMKTAVENTSDVTLDLDTPVDETLGGTGQSAIAAGDLLYGSAVDTLSRLAKGTNTHVLTLASGVPTWAAPGGGVTDHGALTGRGDDDHLQYALLAGRSSGQTLKGGTGAGEHLTLHTTSHASKGSYKLTDLGTGVVKSASGTLSVETPLGETSGGTGQSTYTAGDFLFADGSNSLGKLAAGTTSQVLIGGETPSWGAVNLGSMVTSTLPIGNGGTGVTSLTTNRLLLGGATVSFVGSLGSTTTLLHGGAGAPTFGAVNLTADVTNVLDETNGGTGQSTITAGDILYGSASDVLSKLAKGDDTEVLTLASGVPTWAAPAASGVQSLSGLGAAGTDLVVDGGTSTPQIRKLIAGTGVATLNVEAGGEVTIGLVTPVVETIGGTNQTSYTKGDLLYSDATNSLETLAIGSSSQVLKGGTTPSWGTLEMNDLSDATTSVEVPDQFLRWNGSAWVNAILSTFGNIGLGTFSYELQLDYYDHVGYHSNIIHNLEYSKYLKNNVAGWRIGGLISTTEYVIFTTRLPATVAASSTITLYWDAALHTTQSGTKKIRWDVTWNYGKAGDIPSITPESNAFTHTLDSDQAADLIWTESQVLSAGGLGANDFLTVKISRVPGHADEDAGAGASASVILMATPMVRVLLDGISQA